MVRPPRAVACARPHRRGHAEAEDRDREFLERAVELLQPPGRLGRRAQGRDPRRGRRAVRDSHGRTQRLHHERGQTRRIYITDARPDRRRHRGASRRRAARRHGVPRVVRQDDAGPAHGGGPAQHPDDRRALRLPEGRLVPRPAHRHRGRVPEDRLPDLGRRDARRGQGHGRRRDPEPRRLPRHGHRELDARRLRSARHDAARQRARRGRQREDAREPARVRRAHRRDGVAGLEAARHHHGRRRAQRRADGARPSAARSTA